MNARHFIVLFCTVAVLGAVTSEFVWLRDLNNVAQKRHLDLGQSEELNLQLNRGKKSVNLPLRENPHVRADTDMYVVEVLPDGTKRAVKEPITRKFEGSLMIGDKYFHIDPISDLNNMDRFYVTREYHYTPHVIREEMENLQNIRLTNDTIEPSVDEEEVVNKSIFLNLRKSLDNQNVEERDLDKNNQATKVYGVELLVAVDPPVWKKFYALSNNDTQKAMNRVREYVSHVINGVALTYKSIKRRSFSIDITLKAIVIVKKEEDGPYEKAPLFITDGVWSINAGEYLSALIDWLENTPGIPPRSDFDSAIMLTGYNMIGATGIAYLGGVCSRFGVAVVTEEGYFYTMIVASHELAHILGAKHDSDVGCPQGNIMWMDLPGLVNEYSHRAWEFSKCSIDAFEKTLAQKSCVKDEATFYNQTEYCNYIKRYPGQIYSAEEQCKIAYGQDSYKCGISEPNKICLSLMCYNPQKRKCKRLFAADGTQCGTGNKWCIDGRCVSKQQKK